MLRLEKFVEKSAIGEPSGRSAYVMKFETLPQARDGMFWLREPAFNAANEVLQNPSLKAVFEAAIRDGHSIAHISND